MTSMHPSALLKTKEEKNPQMIPHDKNWNGQSLMRDSRRPSFTCGLRIKYTNVAQFPGKWSNARKRSGSSAWLLVRLPGWGGVVAWIGGMPGSGPSKPDRKTGCSSTCSLTPPGSSSPPEEPEVVDDDDWRSIEPCDFTVIAVDFPPLTDLKIQNGKWEVNKSTKRSINQSNDQ